MCDSRGFYLRLLDLGINHFFLLILREQHKHQLTMSTVHTHIHLQRGTTASLGLIIFHKHLEKSTQLEVQFSADGSYVR